MSLNVIFLDGAEHYARTDKKWKGATHNSAPASGVSGAHGLVSDDAVWGVKRHFINDIYRPTDKGSIRARIIFRANSATNNSFIAALGDSSHTHVVVIRNNDGTVSVQDSLAAHFVHTTVDSYGLDTWYEFEFRCGISGTNGNYLLKVDGVIPSRSGGGKMYASGLNTKNVLSVITAFDLGNAALQTYTDDAVIDTAKNNLGTGQVETLYPNGPGDLAQLTRGGTDTFANFSQCSEAVYDSTTYVFCTAPNQRDCYSFQSLSITGQNYVVQLCGTLEVGSTPGHGPDFGFKFFIRIDGENYDGDITYQAGATNECYQEVWSRNPATGTPWTIEAINAAQFGVLMIDGDDVLLTQLVVEVAALTPTPDFVEAGFRNYCRSIENEVN